MNAPIVLFVYRRFDHTAQVLEALSKNERSKNSELYIFSDAPKNEKAANDVAKVRRLIHSEKWTEAFSQVHIIERESNYGLAKSIISGVTEIVEKYGRVIVIEDDSVSMPGFLSYMNQTLDYYQDNSKIWSIGGYSFLTEEDFPGDYAADVYAMQRTCSYAWATWSDRWAKVDWNVESYRAFKWNFIQRYRFNRVGNNHAVMLDAQKKKRIDSWAIRFCYSMFMNDMVTIYPRYSYIRNIGEDGSGVHFNKSQKKALAPVDLSLAKTGEVKLDCVSEDKRIIKAFANKPTVHLSPMRLLYKYIKNL